MTPRVELVYDRTCPNAEAARARIKEALTKAGLTEEWHEWDRQSADSPPHAQQYASPTVLVNGRDVVANDESATIDGGAGCRVYTDPSGDLSGVPPLDAILAALINSTTTRHDRAG